MDEPQEEKAEPKQTAPQDKPKLAYDKKTFSVIFAVIIILIVAAAIFRLTRRTQPQENPSPSPTVQATPSETLTPTSSPTAKPKPSPTPTPTPTPTPSPTPSPTPTFSVTGVTAAVSPTSYSGSCPKKFDFTANITANAAGTVTYKWARSDNAGSPTETMTFASAGTQATVPDDWTPSASGTRWEKVQILTPNTTESNQATFNLTCT